MVKIDKNIPLPGGAARGKAKYPFGGLDVGDSFFWPEAATRIQNAAFQYGKYNNKKFVTRRCEEEGKQGIRVWRIK